MIKLSKLEKVIYVLFMIFSLAYVIILIVYPRLPFHFVIKIIPIICLLILSILNSKAIIRIFLFGALIFSVIGDVVLGIDIQNLFIVGLIFFLITHFFYIILFFKGFKFNKSSILISIFILIYSIIIGFFLRNIENNYLIPVIVYILTITIMVIGASSYSTNNKYKVAYFVLMGAILFLISDSIIVINKFLYDIPYSDPIVMIFYYLAQFFIVNGFILKGKYE